MFKEADPASVDFLIPTNDDQLELSSQLEPMRYVDAPLLFAKICDLPMEARDETHVCCIQLHGAWPEGYSFVLEQQVFLYTRLMIAIGKPAGLAIGRTIGCGIE